MKRRFWIFLVFALILSSCAAPSEMGRHASESAKAGRRGGAGPYYPDDLRDKISSEYYRLGGKDKLPITLNDQVKGSVDYFLTDARRFMIRSLGRSHKYLPMMQEILKKKGLPPELVYVVLIESGFRADAVSPAAAVGPWQFIAGTAQRYKLTMNDWVDERMDPVRATEAAAGYLSDLHDQFGSWYLALAAYNCGENKIERGLRDNNVTDFWGLSEVKNCLRDETKNYVPRFLAAVLIAMEPERYGLTDIVPLPPDEYEEIELETALDIDVAARLAGVQEAAIRELNPQLKLWATPVNHKNYRLRVPKAGAAAFKQQYAALDPSQRLGVSVHTVRGGESLKSIAGRFQLSADTLRDFNGLSSTQVRSGQQIRLPVDPKVYASKHQVYVARQTETRKTLEKTGEKITYTIRSGDTPWQIAKQFEVDWKDLAAWNKIDDVRKLQPGDKLVVYLGPGPKPILQDKPAEKKPTAPEPDESGVITVRKGETLKQVAKRANLTENQLREYNKLESSKVKPGQVLRLDPPPAEPVKTAKAAPEPIKPDPKKIYEIDERPAGPVGRTTAVSAAAKGSSRTYTVRNGDTLVQIAKNNNLTEAQLRDYNDLTGKLLRVGQVLRLDPAEPEKPTVPAARDSARSDKAEPPAKEQKILKAGGQSYTVLADDTLYKIAAKFQVKPEEIQAANGLSNAVIRPGQTLKIPVSSGMAASPPAPAAPKSAERKASPQFVSYTVQDGDTLWKIARQFKVETAEIRQWNDMKDDRLQPGKVIKIRKEEPI